MLKFNIETRILQSVFNVFDCEGLSRSSKVLKAAGFELGTFVNIDARLLSCNRSNGMPFPWLASQSWLETCALYLIQTFSNTSDSNRTVKRTHKT